MTHSLQESEALALRLAANRPALRDLREKLVRNRLTAPLFDIERYARNLEAAFAHMRMRHYRDGHCPEAFAVTDLT